MIKIRTLESYINTKNKLALIISRLEIIEQNEHLLKNEKEALKEFSLALKNYLISMDNNLKELTGIEYQLYYQIMVRGINVTKAVDKVAFDNDKDVSTIWKNYYPKVKEKIAELENKFIEP